MRTIQRVAAANLLLVLTIPGGAAAGDFDGSKNLICAAIDVAACTEGAQGPECMQGHSRTFGLAEFFRIDFDKKEIRATGNNADVVSPIRNQDKTATQVIMQGVENDRGWTAAVNQSEGTLILTASGQNVSFMVFGACTVL